MRKLIATLFITLDGVIEAPEKWSFAHWNDAIAKFKHDEQFGAGALLLGRVTYEGFAKAWPSRTDEEGFADNMNSIPKHVVSTTLTEATWSNSRLVKGDVAKAVAKLKEEPGKDILIHGSPTLIRFLMKHGLVDEYHLLTYPVVLGAGKRFLQEGLEAKLKLVEAKALGDVAALIYRPAAG